MDDPYLDMHRGAIEWRRWHCSEVCRRITGGNLSLADFASAHEYFGLHREKKNWVFREWAPNATSITMKGDFSNWQELGKYSLSRINEQGHWEIKLPLDALRHGQLYRLKIRWNGGEGDRIPAYARRVVQDEKTKIFNAQVWEPEKPYVWKCKKPVGDVLTRPPLIYESHVGMAQDKEGIGSYCEFRENTLPRIARAGYNTVQLMAVMEHPYYGSFGYHVSSFFAASSRFGTPEELMRLVDEAHAMGLRVIMDIVHSHAVKNEVEGISRFDGTLYQYFHDGPKGNHVAWDSRCFNYDRTEVLHFLLSNCRYWLDAFNMDGFRFDGVTSMLFYDHGLGEGFNSYDDYFSPLRIDAQAQTYLMLANELIHTINPDAITVAEDVSGMPGLGAPVKDGGLGFDYKLAMGVPDFWFKTIKEVRDEDWSTDEIFRELTNRRQDERSISYVECHDQSIVGGKTLIFELVDADMYFAMSRGSMNLAVDRGIALHKLIRLLTLATAGNGYLNFMGNEFGHPEWVDFPREGNEWSCKYARRQWHLMDNHDLKYRYLAEFDRETITLFNSRGLLDHYPELRFSHVSDHVLAFSRELIYFVFNLHPDKSYTDYPVDMPGGTYKLLFESDEERFGGFERIAPDQVFKSSDFNGRNCIRAYLPSRSVMVLQKTVGNRLSTQ